MGFKKYLKEADELNEATKFALAISDSNDPNKVKEYMKEAITRQQNVVSAMKELQRMYVKDIKSGDNGKDTIKSFANLHRNLANLGKETVNKNVPAAGVTDLDSIVKKFLALGGITKKGTKYTYQYGTGKLTLDIKNKKIRGAIFETDRVHDFLEKMEELGFGENIFHTLTKLSSNKTSKGYDTILTF